MLQKNAKIVDKGVAKAKNNTVVSIGNAGDESTANVMNHSAKVLSKYTKKAEVAYKDAAEDVKEERKEQFKKVDEDAAQQAKESKVRIIKEADRISVEKSTEANILALKTASNDAKALISAAHHMEEDVSEAAHRSREAARDSYDHWKKAQKQAFINKDYTVKAYEESNIAKYEALGAGEEVQTGYMSGNMATHEALKSEDAASKVDWKAKTVKKLADKIKAQVDTTHGAIIRLTKEIDSAIKEASAANWDARQATEHAQKILRMGALSSTVPAAPAPPMAAPAPASAAPAPAAPAAPLLQPVFYAGPAPAPVLPPAPAPQAAPVVAPTLPPIR